MCPCVPTSGRVFLSRPSLVMKGSAVRIRASASVDQRSSLQKGHFLRLWHATVPATECPSRTHRRVQSGFSPDCVRAIPRARRHVGSLFPTAAVAGHRSRTHQPPRLSGALTRAALGSVRCRCLRSVQVVPTISPRRRSSHGQARVRDVLVIPSPGHRADEQAWLDYPAVEDAVDWVTACSSSGCELMTSRNGVCFMEIRCMAQEFSVGGSSLCRNTA